MAESASVKVFARFRPYNSREKAIGLEAEKAFIKLHKGGAGNVKLGTHDFTFDHVYPMDCTQEQVYENVALPMIEDVMTGYNGTLFAYGQTGSGKSFSMMGCDNWIEHPDLWGVIPRATRQIFHHISQAPMEVTFSLSVSYLEVYREVIRDLLDPSKNNLSVRESPTQGIYVDGASVAFVTSEDEVFHAIAVGDASRAVAATNMNAHSSRSHSLFIMKVTQKNEIDGSVKVGTLNLVDLAGSEKISKTGASGSTLEEAKKINQSLSSLANVINALADGKPHIPFRDSKLTRILQQSLGGNCKTSLLIALSPHSNNEGESMSTLRFGQRAKTIKTQVKMNEQKSAEELEILVGHLRKELQTLQAYTSSLEAKLTEAGIALPTQAEVKAAAVAAAKKKGDDAALQSAASMSEAGTPSSGGGPALSGKDAAAFEKLRIAYSALQEDESFAKQQIEDLRAETAEAQMEAGKYEKQVTELQALREKERVLASRAVADVKALRQEVSKKNQLGMQALQEMKKLQVKLGQSSGEVVKEREAKTKAETQASEWKSKAVTEEAEKKRVSAELEEAQTWLKEMQAKVEAVLKLAAQSSEEKTAALLEGQQDLELKLEEERALVSSLRKKDSDTAVQLSSMQDQVAAAKAEADATIDAAAKQHATALKNAEDAAEQVRSEMEASFLKQINELRQTQEDLQKKLAEKDEKAAEDEKSLEAARKLVMVSGRTGSGPGVFPGSGGGDAGSPVARAMNDSSDAWLTLQQNKVGVVQSAQQEEEDANLAEIRKQHAVQLAEVERTAEAKVMLMQQEIEATKSAAAQEARREVEQKFEEEKAKMEATIKASAEAEEKRVKAAEDLANQRIEEVKQQAQRDIEMERAAAVNETGGAKAAVEAATEEAERKTKEVEDRLGSKIAALEQQAVEAKESHKASSAEAQAELSRLREASEAKLLEAEERHAGKITELEKEMEDRVKAAGGGASAEAAEAERLSQQVREQAKKDVEQARAAAREEASASREELERVKAAAEERVAAAEKKTQESADAAEVAAKQMAEQVDLRSKQAVEKERAETERVKQYAHARLAELEKVANEKVNAAEKQAEMRVLQEQEMARQRFQQLQQQAHAQVAEMQEQTNAKIEDFRAQAQKYVTDARQQSVQQAERDLKGQYDAKLLEAEQKSTRLEQQLQQLQLQLQQMQQQQQQGRMGMMGMGGMRGGGLRGGMGGGGGGLRGGANTMSPTPFAQAGMSTFGQNPQTALKQTGGIGALGAAAAAAATPEGVPPSSPTTPGSMAQGSKFIDPRQDYKPQLNVPNTHVNTLVAKTGFLIKSSAGKKDVHGHEVTTKHEKFQNRFFAIVDGPQPHIAWFKDQKDYKAKKAPQGTLALRQGTATIQKGVDSSLLPMSFIVSTPERNLKLKTLEGQDANEWVKLINIIADAMRKRTAGGSAGS